MNEFPGQTLEDEIVKFRESLAVTRNCSDYILPTAGIRHSDPLHHHGSNEKLDDKSRDILRDLAQSGNLRQFSRDDALTRIDRLHTSLMDADRLIKTLQSVHDNINANIQLMSMNVKPEIDHVLLDKCRGFIEKSFTGYYRPFREGTEEDAKSVYEQMQEKFFSKLKYKAIPIYPQSCGGDWSYWDFEFMLDRKYGYFAVRFLVPQLGYTPCPRYATYTLPTEDMFGVTFGYSRYGSGSYASDYAIAAKDLDTLAQKVNEFIDDPNANLNMIPESYKTDEEKARWKDHRHSSRMRDIKDCGEVIGLWEKILGKKFEIVENP